MRKFKKVAILTINDRDNYGNRLQNYAVQQVLKKMKWKVVTIENERNIYKFNYIKRKIKYLIKIMFPIKNNWKRESKFLKFNFFNIKYAKFGIDENHIPKNIDKKFDCFFTGSDQVWNPTFGRMTDIDFLTFAPKEKRNSFSASIGINSIPDDLKDYYTERLLNMNNISVREDRAKELVEELTKRNDIEVLIDPTMMLTKEEWRKVEKKPKQLKTNRYILNYFLGELQKEKKELIEKCAKENDCEIINILDPNDKFYNTGPSEFLYLEKNAFLICTDSFHSCVFAIIYNRPFIIFDRNDKFENMNSRLDTLLNKFQLENRKYKTAEKINEKLLKYDYTNTYKILEKERKKTEKFIKNVLE